ncbi:MauE/DoxX family redox-associated membrane protein [Maribacter sp. 2307ULW6-5]|uniref:DoxX family protein n=1 Tax=Maribacter sp. 2307ULW6-5 TaxID=3386275 RepID=UPI0039BC24DE
MLYPWHLYLMAALYIVAGTMHFVRPNIYLRIMPRYLPAHRALVFWSGVAEIALGVGLCFPQTKNWAVWGIILMLFLFLSVHFYMLKGKKESAGVPRPLLLARIPLQFGLMYWAHAYLAL